MESKLLKAYIKVDPQRLPAPITPQTPVLKPKQPVIRDEEPKRRQPAWTPERDQCLLMLLAEGKSHRECAAELGTSKGAVNKRVQRLRKMGVEI